MRKHVLAFSLIVILIMTVVLTSCSNSSYVGLKYAFNDQSWEELAGYWETDKSERTGKKNGDEITYIFGTITRPSYSIWFRNKENVIVYCYDKVYNYTYTVEKQVIILTENDGTSFGLGSFSKDYRSITIDCPYSIFNSINNCSLYLEKKL